MPELPDILLYTEALQRHVVDRVIEEVSVRSPFLVRTVSPPISSIRGNTVIGTQHIGKRVVLNLTDEVYLVFHLMIAGRFKWRPVGTKPKSRNDLMCITFPHGVLLLTEAGTKKRASLHIAVGADELEGYDPGGLDVLTCTAETFASRLRWENHTLKRALTDPRLFSGIGNAYSDEILHRAGMSPFQWTSHISDEETETLLSAVQSTMRYWIQLLRDEVGKGFPEKVTAFRTAMAVHGKFGMPCPVCRVQVQRIVYGDRETNYCPGCQTNGNILADRALSRILKKDWPRNMEELDRTP